MQHVDDILVVEMEEHANFPISSFRVNGRLKRTPEFLDGDTETQFAVIR